MSGLKSKADDPREQVLALICGNDEPWAWGGDAHQCRISFNRDGTGALDCGENQCSWIASEFNWAFSAEPVRADNGSWTIPIQMTLSTRIASYLQKDNHWFQGAALQNHVENPPPASDGPFSWAPLRAAAFRPKQYTLTLSYGNFIEPFHYFIKRPYPLLQSGSDRFAPNRFSRKLAFDKSPYPPLEEWADTYDFGNLKGSLRYHHYWERTDFVRGPFGWKRQMWENFLDLGWWLSPSAGDGYLR